ncbi:NAD(P)-binding protein [bacterium]|nr:NAD(P)-binding protein [bacterium]
MPETYSRGQKIALIIGAGPAGLAAAHELLRTTDYTPLIIEREKLVGGIAKTMPYKGNLIDMGPHRFFSKSDFVRKWWGNFLPPQMKLDAPSCPQHHGNDVLAKCTCDVNPDSCDEVMLVCNRLTRIYHDKKCFEYPLSMSLDTIKKLGIINLTSMAASYGYTRLFPRKPEKTLEDFFINRFGVKVYQRFFESYSEKIWGIHPAGMSADWGAQRVKNVSIAKTIGHAIRSLVPENFGDRIFGEVERSFVGRFLYPKLGAGQMWTKVADSIEKDGGIILREHEALSVKVSGDKVIGVTVRDIREQKDFYVPVEQCFSSTPVRNLIDSIDGRVPRDVAEVASGLKCRGFINVGVLLKDFSVPGAGPNAKDNWIYIQEPYAKAARLTIFNNWSSALVADTRNKWISLELYAQPGDEFWGKSDKKIIEFSVNELVRLKMAKQEDVLESVVHRIPEATPIYVGAYERLDVVQRYVDDIKNLYMMGRCGMHRYNNQDHAVLSGIKAVESIARAGISKTDVWQVNDEKSYHEEENA